MGPKVFAAIVIALTIASGLLGLLLPVPAGSEKSLLNHYLYSATTLITAASHVGAAIFFARGFKGFTHGLKVAYGIFCIGLAMYGLAQLQLPILGMLNALDSLWVRGGFVVLPYVLPSLTLFFGIKAFAKLFNVQVRYASFWLLAAIGTIFGILASFIPHASTILTERELDVTVGLSAWNIPFNIATALIILRVKAAAGAVYYNSLAWVFVALIGILAMTFNYLFTMYALGYEHWYISSGTILVPFILVGFCWIRAAYAFNTLQDQERIVAQATSFTFFGKPHSLKQNPNITPVDVVLYAAQLVSAPAAIDLSLDKVRSVTSKLGADEQPSKEQVEALRQAYLEIENYLATEEPVRKMSKEALRQNIKERLSVHALQLLYLEQAA